MAPAHIAPNNSRPGWSGLSPQCIPQLPVSAAPGAYRRIAHQRVWRFLWSGLAVAERPRGRSVSGVWTADIAVPSLQRLSISLCGAAVRWFRATPVAGSMTAFTKYGSKTRLEDFYVATERRGGLGCCGLPRTRFHFQRRAKPPLLRSQLHALLKHLDRQIRLLFSGDEWRCDANGARATAEEQDAAFECQLDHAVALGGGRLLGLLVSHEFHADH